jgi:hypothetical protein
MTKYNAIILSDISDPIFLNKNVAPFTLANNLRNNGIDVTVIHHLNMWNFDELVEVVKFLVNNNTLFVGFSNFFYRLMETNSKTGEISFNQSHPNVLLPHGLDDGNTLVKIIKQINNDCKIIIGGAAATDNISNKHIDFIFKGYADKTILDFVNFLIQTKKGSTVTIPDYWYKNLYGINVVNGVTYQDNNFVSTALKWLPKDAVLPGETLPIEIARGCIFQCKFCSYPLNGKKNLEHIKDIKVLKEEFIHNYEKFGVTRYFFLDDTFNDSIEKLEMIEEVSKKLPFNLEYWAYIRLDLIAAKPHSLKILHNSGLRAAHLGLETLNKKTGSIIGKGADPKKLIETIGSIKKQYGSNLLLHSSFIIGLPEENEESVTNTANQILNKEVLVDSADFHSLVIQPKGFTNYLSAFGLDFNQYGYTQKEKHKITDLEKLYTNDAIAWQNEHMDLHRAIELAVDFNKKMWNSNNMRSSMAFQIANLGFELEDFTSKKLVDIDWHLLKTTKCKRFDDYKSMFLKNIRYK